MTVEQKVEKTFGELMLRVLSLETQLEIAQARVVELEKSAAAKQKKDKPA